MRRSNYGKVRGRVRGEGWLGSKWSRKENGRVSHVRESWPD